ncbi:hypothetical protein HaLaN_19311 [Haematococcus lacustris]|uniref:Uncharacterized protein n=1 Tax=Haematococcus lacustris TaxID=44745 RepID=A0A699ZT34_HAELA|nr:hypothetical protein HaLaN_19311 [Haematococcus lacustris]
MVWRVFPTQQQAFDFLDAQPGALQPLLSATDTNVTDGGGIQEAVDSAAAADPVAAPLATAARRGPGPEDEDEAYQEACELALQQLENQGRV